MKLDATKVMVGPIPYTIKVVDELHTEDKKGRKTKFNGWHEEHTQEIFLCGEMPVVFEKVVLLHELLHAIFTIGGHPNPHDEPTIERLSYGLVDLLRQNPDFIKALVDSLQPSEGVRSDSGD